MESGLTKTIGFFRDPSNLYWIPKAPSPLSPPRNAPIKGSILIALLMLKKGERIAEIKGNISDVEVFPKSIVEWWLVPIKTGEFDDLHCYVKDKKAGKTHSEMGMVGTIIVY